MKFNFVSTALFIFVFTTIQYSQNNIPDFFTFQFNSSSTVIINSNNDNKVHSIWGQFGNLLPHTRIKTDTLSSNIFQNSSLIYRINMPTSGCSLFMDKDIKLDLFLVPNDTLFITLDFTDTNKVMQNIEFKGRFASINKYLLKKNIDINGELFKRRLRVRNPRIDLAAFADSLDSIDNVELEYLNNYNKTNNLPGWYLRYENNRKIYSSSELKINQPSYIEHVTSKEGKIPQYYFDFLNKIKIDNNESIILINYFQFLENYFYEKYFSQEIKRMNYNSERDQKSIAIDLQCADKYLTGEVEDIFKCFIISDYIILHPEISQFIDSVINEQSNRFNYNKYLSFLKDFSKNTLRLNPGDKAPDFYLPDQNNQYVNLTDYKGKVILLNFWFPGCAPCRKEIPFEKKLEEDFKGKNFSLINICEQTSKENWIDALSKLNLVGINLFAVGNWENILNKSYFINSWPHYTLIDKNGNIYSNNPNRPSEGISEDIIKLLSE